MADLQNVDVSREDMSLYSPLDEEMLVLDQVLPLLLEDWLLKLSMEHDLIVLLYLDEPLSSPHQGTLPLLFC